MYLCSMEANVTLSNLTIGYPHHTVQQHLNGTIRAGRLTCVVGENGCGKSTRCAPWPVFLSHRAVA